MPTIKVIAKTKPVAKPSVEVKADQSAVDENNPENLTDEQLADLYGRLDDEMESILANAVFAKHKMAKEELLKRLAKYAPENELTLKGEKWKIDAGACSKTPRKVINNAAVQKAVGSAAFLEIAKVSVSDAEKYLTPAQQAGVFTDPEYTTNRKLTCSYLGD